MDVQREPRRWFLIVFLVPAAAAVWLERTRGWHPVAAWWVAANVWVLPLWAWDKFQARRKGWRVPEATLHGMAILGAAPASLVAMEVLRHKTRKPWFRRLYVFLTLLQAAGFAYWWFEMRPR